MLGGTEFAGSASQFIFLKQFQITEHWRKAQLAAFWDLNKVLQSNKSFSGTCIALANVMDISQQYKDVNTNLRVENYAINSLQVQMDRVMESDDLGAIAQLYFSIFTSKYVLYLI